MQCIMMHRKMMMAFVKPEGKFTDTTIFVPDFSPYLIGESFDKIPDTVCLSPLSHAYTFT